MPFEGRLEDALVEILDVADFVAPLEMPEFPRDAELVSMVNDAEYPINVGDMASTRGRAWTAETYEQVTEEVHVAHSNALALGLHRHADAVLRRSARPREPERGDG